MSTHTTKSAREIHFAEGQLFTTLHDRPETALADVHQSAAKIVAELPSPFIRYAMSAERGEFAGFAALHDKCDANMFLPFADSNELDEFQPSANQTICDFWNEVMEEVTRLMRLWVEREELFAELGRYVSNDANYTGRGKSRRISLETGKAGQMRARIVKLNERLAFYPVAQ